MATKHPRIESGFKGGGKCSICGDSVIVVARCSVTGLKVGKCCVMELHIADAALSNVPGISHPDRVL